MHQRHCLSSLNRSELADGEDVFLLGGIRLFHLLWLDTTTTTTTHIRETLEAGVTIHRIFERFFDDGGGGPLRGSRGKVCFLVFHVDGPSPDARWFDLKVKSQAIVTEKAEERRPPVQQHPNERENVK